MSTFLKTTVPGHCVSHTLTFTKITWEAKKHCRVWDSTLESLNQEFQMVPVPYSYIDSSLLDNMKKGDKINCAGNCLGGFAPRLAPTRRHVKLCKSYKDEQEQWDSSNFRNMMCESLGIVEDTQQICSHVVHKVR